ncbi:MAG TPA: alcohol dehydrogenase catalytic domain-containing protein [Solirubrobacteraceae bacterium]|nr:alcohol dehydrogenase catalytic domain-containing protein [Solirubrobacteraceae bacterium]
MRAALLFGNEDLRVLDVADPVPGPGEVLVRIEAATTCGTDVKTWQRGHPLVTTYPARFGHEMAGEIADAGPGVTSVAPGDRVLVGDSVACGRCRHCAAGRPQICAEPQWVFGGFAELMVAPAGALHRVPDALEPAAAAMAEPLAAAVHAIARAPAHGLAPDVGVLGGGPMGQMLAALLVAEGRTVTLADRHAERRAQAEAAGAASADRLGDHDVVFEAVGRPDAWREAVQACAPGGCVVFVGGCKGGTDAVLPTRPLHYDELDLRGAFHHSRQEVDRALALLAAGALDWRALAAGPIGLDDLADALAAGNQGPARKWVVMP